MRYLSWLTYMTYFAYLMSPYDINSVILSLFPIELVLSEPVSLSSFISTLPIV